MKQILEGEAADAVRSYQDEGLGKRSPLLWPLYYSLDLAKEVTDNNKGIICVCVGGAPPTELPWLSWMRVSLPRHDLLG